MILTDNLLKTTITKASCCLAEKAAKYSKALSLGKNDKCLLKEITLLERYIKILNCYRVYNNPTSPEPIPVPEPTPPVPPPPPVCSYPTVQAEIQAFTGTNGFSTTINWTRGNGSKVIVVGRRMTGGYDALGNWVAAPTSTTEQVPVDGFYYNSSPIFGLGDITGPENYVVYVGTGTSVYVKGLLGEACYNFIVYEFNDTVSPLTCYFIPGTGDTVCTECQPPNVQAQLVDAVPTFDPLTSTYSWNITWNRGNGNRILVAAADGLALPIADPVNGTLYNANTVYGSGDPLGGGYVIYDGNGSSVITTGYTSSITVAVWEYNSSCYLTPSNESIYFPEP
jgi:hypothetical protein